MAIVQFSSFHFLISVTIFVLLSSLQFPVATGDNNLISQTCRRTPFVQLCLDTLQSNPRSKNEDVGGLGLIVVDAIKRNAIKVAKQIKKLQQSSPPALLKPLSICQDSYKFIINDFVPVAEQALRGNPKFAEDVMVSTAQEAETCENGFRSAKTPLSNLNKLIHNLADVGRAITRNLL